MRYFMALVIIGCILLMFLSCSSLPEMGTGYAIVESVTYSTEDGFPKFRSIFRTPDSRMIMEFRDFQGYQPKLWSMLNVGEHIQFEYYTQGDGTYCLHSWKPAPLEEIKK